MTQFLGIDPGRKGAFALLDEAGQFVDVWDMPLVSGAITAHAIYGQYKQIQERAIKPFTVIEKPFSKPTDGRNSIATYHFESGQLMLIAAFGWPVTLIQPAIWTRVMHVGLPEDLSAKQASLQAFKNLFPELADSKRFIDGKKIYDGRIDAILIAEYARRLHNGAGFVAGQTRERKQV